ECLAHLLELYRSGSRRPERYLRDCSRIYAWQLRKHSSLSPEQLAEPRGLSREASCVAADALATALKLYENPWGYCEVDDPYTSLLFRGYVPLTASGGFEGPVHRDFAFWSLGVWRPLLAARCTHKRASKGREPVQRWLSEFRSRQPREQA
ncbi:MAG: hypothetical protein D6731_13745, partial [Planctomycetota bacterium]